MKMPLLSLVLLVAVTPTLAQDRAMVAGNSQRTRVLLTKGPADVPQNVVWTSKKLFHYRAYNEERVTAGPLSFWVDIPTYQDFSLPIVANGIVYLTYNSSKDGYFFALDALSGDQLVTLKFEKNHISMPAAAGAFVYFASARAVHAYDARKQQLIWKFSDKVHTFDYASLAIHNDRLIVAGRDLFVLDASTGNVIWSFQPKAGISAVAVGDGKVVFVTGELLIALDWQDGSKRWEQKVGQTYSPAILGDLIFLRSKAGEIRVFQLRDGAPAWKARRRGGAATALALHDGMVIYGGREDSVYALDTRNGEEKWQFKTQRPCLSPIIADSIVYISCSDRKLYALEVSTGREKWRYDNKKATPPPPTFADGTMYMLGMDGILTAVR